MFSLLLKELIFIFYANLDKFVFMVFVFLKHRIHINVEGIKKALSFLFVLKLYLVKAIVPEIICKHCAFVILTCIAIHRGNIYHRIM